MSLFHVWRRGRSSNRAAYRSTPLQVEQLESRTVLNGDIVVGGPGPGGPIGNSLSQVILGTNNNDWIIIENVPGPITTLLITVRDRDNPSTLISQQTVMAGDVFVRGLDGNDLIENRSSHGCTLEGGNGDDRILGGRAGELILAGADNDVVDGGDGNDTIRGNDGDDKIYGGLGGDTLEGGTGFDLLYGGERSSAIRDSAKPPAEDQDFSDDTLYGGSDDDFLFGGHGNDTLYGNSGFDALYGESGEDTADGGDDDDYLDGGRDDDTLRGGPGDDTIYGGVGVDEDTIEGGDGNDTLWGGGGSDTIIGNAGNDTLYGNSPAGTEDDQDLDTLYGDELSSKSDNDTDGDDTLYGGNKRNHMYGGGGADTFHGGNGDGGGPGQAVPDPKALINRMYGNTGNDTMYGGSRWDEIWGNDGADFLQGYGGTDTINGGDADDVIFGGEGNDFLFGEDGNDAIFGGTYAPNIGFCPSDLFNVWDIWFAGGSTGEAGDDVLDGGADHDLLVGDKGEDHLYGQTGDDLLFGGPGTDEMLGGADTDTFFLSDSQAEIGGLDMEEADLFLGEVGWNFKDGHYDLAVTYPGTIEQFAARLEYQVQSRNPWRVFTVDATIEDHTGAFMVSMGTVQINPICDG